MKPTASPAASPRLRLLALLLAFGAGAAAAQSGASGTVTIDGETWPVADAVAVSDDGDIELWFSKLEFDRAEWAEDGEFDTFDTHDFKDDGDGPALRIDVDEEDGRYGGHTVRFGSSSSSGGYSSDLAESLTLTTRDDKRIAGTVKFDDGSGLAADIRFDLPLTATGPLARAGTPLPKDGGEPGKALKAMVEATHAGNLEKMMALSHPERRAGIEAAKAAGEAEEMLRMAKLFTPKITKITGGTSEGDQAWVDFDGQEEGDAVKGSAELSRVDGQWYIKRISTRSGD
jgi:hypothetical protein